MLDNALLSPRILTVCYSKASYLAVNLGFCGIPGFAPKSHGSVFRAFRHDVETLRLTRSLITRNEDVNTRFRVSQKCVLLPFKMHTLAALLLDVVYPGTSFETGIAYP